MAANHGNGREKHRRIGRSASALLVAFGAEVFAKIVLALLEAAAHIAQRGPS